MSSQKNNKGFRGIIEKSSSSKHIASYINDSKIKPIVFDLDKDDNINSNKPMEELQNKIRSWSGFEIEGETKQELKESLSTVRDQLINEACDQARKYEKLIDNLDIPEGI